MTSTNPATISRVGNTLAIGQGYRAEQHHNQLEGPARIYWPLANPLPGYQAMACAGVALSWTPGHCAYVAVRTR